MTSRHSPDAARFIHDVQNLTSELGIRENVIVASGAQYLAADAMGVESRYPADIDTAIPPCDMPVVAQRLQTLGLPVRTVPRPEHGYAYYSFRLRGMQIDVGPQWGEFSYDELRAGAQTTLEGLAFASLNAVIKHKLAHGRPQDLQDVKSINSILSRFRGNVQGLACTAEAALGHTNAAETARLLMPSSRHAPIAPALDATLQGLRDDALYRMAVRYGSGFPNFQYPEQSAENRQLLWYNTGRHAYEVYQDGGRLARAMGLGELVYRTVEVAGAAHDGDQTCVIADPTVREGYDELHSAQEMIEQQRKKGVDPVVALWTAYFTMGTGVKTEGSRMVGQAGKFLVAEAFPCEEAHVAAQMGADADMGHIYVDLRPQLCLPWQRAGFSPLNAPDFRNPRIREIFSSFLRSTEGFFVEHTYALDEAEELFGRNRQRMVDHVGELIERDKAGNTPDTWEGVIAAENTFADECA